MEADFTIADGVYDTDTIIIHLVDSLLLLPLPPIEISSPVLLGSPVSNTHGQTVAWGR